MTLFPKRRIEALVFERTGMEALLYDERTHQAFCLNPVLTAVWTGIDGRRSAEELAAVATRELEQPVTVEGVRVALAMLRERGLLEADEPVAAGLVAGTMNRRGLLAGMGASSALLVPGIAMIAAPRAAQAYATGGCVLGHTPVRLPGGASLPIAEVRAGQIVEAVDMDSGATTHVTVSGVHRGKTPAIHRLVTASGDTLYASPSHLLMTRVGDMRGREVRSLRQGEQVLVYHPQQARFVETALVQIDVTPSDDDVYHLKTQKKRQAIIAGAHPSVSKFQ